MADEQTHQDWKSNPVVIGLLLAFITPVGLILMWLSDWQKKTKQMITAVIAVIYVAPLLLLLLLIAAVPSVSRSGSPSSSPIVAQVQPGDTGNSSSTGSSTDTPATTQSQSSAATTPGYATSDPTPAQVSTGEPSGTSGSTSTTTAVSAPPTQPAKAGTPSQAGMSGPAAVMREHLDDINSGNYQQAFALMSASYRAQNPSWLSNHTRANPGITVISVGQPSLSSKGAEVPVDFYARDRNPTSGSDTNCREFTGTVTVIQTHGVWRYDPAGTLTSTIVPRRHPNCPT